MVISVVSLVPLCFALYFSVGTSQECSSCNTPCSSDTSSASMSDIETCIICLHECQRSATTLSSRGLPAPAASPSGNAATGYMLSNLSWSSTLASEAQSIAEVNCNDAYATVPSSPLGFGVNAASGAATFSAVMALFSCSPGNAASGCSYDFVSNNCSFAGVLSSSSSCYTYTQILWYSLTSVGCARVSVPPGGGTCATDSTRSAFPPYWVCVYAPAGNVVSTAASSVHSPGRTLRPYVPATDCDNCTALPGSICCGNGGRCTDNGTGVIGNNLRIEYTGSSASGFTAVATESLLSPRVDGAATCNCTGVFGFHGPNCLTTDTSTRTPTQSTTLTEPTIAQCADQNLSLCPSGFARAMCVSSCDTECPSSGAAGVAVCAQSGLQGTAACRDLSMFLSYGLYWCNVTQQCVSDCPGQCAEAPFFDSENQVCVASGECGHSGMNGSHAFIRPIGPHILCRSNSTCLLVLTPRVMSCATCDGFASLPLASDECLPTPTLAVVAFESGVYSSSVGSGSLFVIEASNFDVTLNATDLESVVALLRIVAVSEDEWQFVASSGNSGNSLCFESPSISAHELWKDTISPLLAEPLTYVITQNFETTVTILAAAAARRYFAEDPDLQACLLFCWTYIDIGKLSRQNYSHGEVASSRDVAAAATNTWNHMGLCLNVSDCKAGNPSTPVLCPPSLKCVASCTDCNSSVAFHPANFCFQPASYLCAAAGLDNTSLPNNFSFPTLLHSRYCPSYSSWVGVCTLQANCDTCSGYPVTDPAVSDCVSAYTAGCTFRHVPFGNVTRNSFLCPSEAICVDSSQSAISLPCANNVVLHRSAALYVGATECAAPLIAQNISTTPTPVDFSEVWRCPLNAECVASCSSCAPFTAMDTITAQCVRPSDCLGCNGLNCSRLYCPTTNECVHSSCTSCLNYPIPMQSQCTRCTLPLYMCGSSCVHNCTASCMGFPLGDNSSAACRTSCSPGFYCPSTASCVYDILYCNACPSFRQEDFDTMRCIAESLYECQVLSLSVPLTCELFYMIAASVLGTCVCFGILGLLTCFFLRVCAAKCCNKSRKAVKNDFELERVSTSPLEEPLELPESHVAAAREPLQETSVESLVGPTSVAAATTVPAPVLEKKDAGTQSRRDYATPSKSLDALLESARMRSALRQSPLLQPPFHFNPYHVQAPLYGSPPATIIISPPNPLQSPLTYGYTLPDSFYQYPLVHVSGRSSHKSRSRSRRRSKHHSSTPHHSRSLPLSGNGTIHFNPGLFPANTSLIRRSRSHSHRSRSERLAPQVPFRLPVLAPSVMDAAVPLSMSRAETVPGVDHFAPSPVALSSISPSLDIVPPPHRSVCAAMRSVSPSTSSSSSFPSNCSPDDGPSTLEFSVPRRRQRLQHIHLSS